MLLSLALLLAQAAASEPVEPGEPLIIVEGAAKTDAEIRAEAQTFVRAVAAMPGTADQLPRWNEPICAKVIGATAAEEKPVLERIRDVAADAGIRVARRRNCDPNILIAFADDPSGVVRQVFEKRPHTARAVSPTARAALVDGAYPVRWWYDLKVEGRFGETPVGDMPALLGALDTNSGPGFAPGGGFAQSENQAGNVSDYSSSMIGSKSRQSIGGATIVVDVRRVRGLTHGALASFVAMVALAPMKLPPKPVATPTITNLFSDSPAERETDLTTWDRAYLAALYKVAANRSADVQRSSMTAEIAKNMRGGK